MRKYALMLFYTAGELGEETLPSNTYLLKDILDLLILLEYPGYSGGINIFF